MIVVAGVASGSGKTTASETIIGYLSKTKSVAAGKITVIHGDTGCPHGSRSCNTCSSFVGDFQIITKPSIINQEGTDTNRFVKAGGSPVLWTITKENVFENSWNLMKKSFGESSYVVVESNTLALVERPVITLMIVDPTVSRKIWKHSAEKLITVADVLIFNKRGSSEQIIKTMHEIKRLRVDIDDVIYLSHPKELVKDKGFLEMLNHKLI